MNFTLSPFAPENFVSRDGFGSLIPLQPAPLYTQAESDAYLWDSSRVPRRRPFIYVKPPHAIGSVPSISGHANAYRWRPLPRVRRHTARGTGPVYLKVVPNGCCLGRSPWTNKYAPLFPTPTIGYEVGMLKVPAYITCSWLTIYQVFNPLTVKMGRGCRDSYSEEGLISGGYLCAPGARAPVHGLCKKTAVGANRVGH